MPRFLGIKSYLTTNRSSIRKQESTKIRRSHLSESAILRENIADRLRCPMCFCLPCFVAVVVMFVFIVAFVTEPYMQGMYCINCYVGASNKLRAQFYVRINRANFTSLRHVKIASTLGVAKTMRPAKKVVIRMFCKLLAPS